MRRANQASRVVGGDEAGRLLDQEHVGVEIPDRLDQRMQVAARLPQVPGQDPQVPAPAP
ncbi:hypothetical protein [Brachybacterium sp. GPGPB12]|uniref:hypothetical protein n=1 Tax=Brachybacterium sp. GPGPB12 TaxID=3023517 RepID=UPI00313450F3